MDIFKTIRDINFLKEKLISQKQNLGFVPTMGALHEGHISLVKKSVLQNSYTLVSIFVNPTQFNDKNDLLNYPRTVEKDIEMLKNANCNGVFLPEIIEMYPETDNRIFDFDGIENIMEGKYRPGHFNGVAQIVSKLFDTIRPDNAYFGKKDFQQLAVIRKLNKKYLSHLNINIEHGEIIRDPDGLAMSSRNMLLLPEYRKIAPIIHQTLKKYSKSFQKYSVDQIQKFVIDEINKTKLLNVEYFEIVDNETLLKSNKIIPGKTTGCIAVFAGKIRLIDNISF